VQPDNGYSAFQIRRKGCRRTPTDRFLAMKEHAPGNGLVFATEQAVDQRRAVSVFKCCLADKIGLGHVDEVAEPGLEAVADRRDIAAFRTWVLKEAKRDSASRIANLSNETH
jgi:hypothetical protein